MEKSTVGKSHRTSLWLIEFLAFGIKQAWACLFAGLMLALIIFMHFFWPKDCIIARYDALFVSALAIQAALIAFKLESWEEVKVIMIFHVIGTIMELFKTHMGSWHYPEANVIRLGGVPLFSGFMYASVGSYMARVTRIFDMRYSHYPAIWKTVVFAVLIYLNFFTHHYMPDVRGALFVIAGALFGSVSVYFTPWHERRRMPLLVGFCLVAFFIWLAENIGTFTAFWLYPNQKSEWHLVGFGKMGSWFLLMIISFVLVTLVHKPRKP